MLLLFKKGKQYRLNGFNPCKVLKKVPGTLALNKYYKNSLTFHHSEITTIKILVKDLFRKYQFT